MELVTEDTRENCTHEDGITYGEQISVPDTDYQIVHLLCESCGAVGTQLEQQDSTDLEHWEPIDEMWHSPNHYFNNTLSKQYTIGLELKDE